MTDSTIEAAIEAVDLLGGPTRGAERLSEYYGRPIGRMTIQNWKRYGVTPAYVLGVEALTGVSRYRLDPEHHPRPARHSETAA